MKKVMVVFGTRPEAIKMAPVIRALRNRPSEFDLKVCSTGQHRQMLDQVLNMFRIQTDFELNTMTQGQSLTGLTGKILTGMEQIFQEWRPDILLVQGDTTTVLAASLAAFYQKIRIAHVEAGLRTGNINSPWPEEMNRLLATRMAALHFAPTESARNNLLREAVPASTIHVTGNTVIDALFEAIRIMDHDSSCIENLKKKFSFLDSSKRMILVTGHRRENFGEGFLHICHAIADISKRGDVQILYPVHMNPNVREPVTRILGSLPNVQLAEPQDYPAFLYLMRQSTLILTDSGGVQEEAPSLGKPVVVMRDTTERPEAVEAGTVVLAGTDSQKITSYVNRLLDDSTFFHQMAKANNPYGDGKASERIADILAREELAEQPQ